MSVVTQQKQRSLLQDGAGDGAGDTGKPAWHPALATLPLSLCCVTHRFWRTA